VIADPTRGSNNRQLVEINIARSFCQAILERPRQAAKITVVEVGKRFKCDLGIEFCSVNGLRGGKRCRQVHTTISRQSIDVDVIPGFGAHLDHSRLGCGQIKQRGDLQSIILGDQRRQQAWNTGRSAKGQFDHSASVNGAAEGIGFALRDDGPRQEGNGRNEIRRIEGLVAKEVKIDRLAMAEVKRYRRAAIEYEGRGHSR
jgi:hypothetical protein